MKKITLAFIAIFLMNSAHALSDKQCRNIYNDSFESLLNASYDFNSRVLDKYEFAAKVTTISSSVTAIRAACAVVESPRNKNCVNAYKKRYKNLRKEIKVGSVLIGNQTRVRQKHLELAINEFNTILNRIKCDDL
jgi:septation ring formation regulator EzrA